MNVALQRAEKHVREVPEPVLLKGGGVVIVVISSTAIRGFPKVRGPLLVSTYSKDHSRWGPLWSSLFLEILI